jgi:alpha-D-ribose 1-methylphosphonate 5-triphosphate synthase subunit PhnH
VVAAVGVDLARIGRGFADPVFESQTVFRHLLWALSRPGEARSFQADLDPPSGFLATTAAVLLTLVDFETPVHLAIEADATLAAGYLRFHAGCTLVSEAGRATFVVADAARAAEVLEACSVGTDLYPDRGAPLIVQVPALAGGRAVELIGPGIKTARMIAPAGLATSFWMAAQVNAARYPLGVDIVLVAPEAILGVPRSSTIRLAEGA